ncbi:MAG: dTMP kinase [Methylotenera sp.]|uniref:dTMP kinase n=1 Tax=Methylotenera sp. TaxID=2051956 RepID=UPI00248768A8|nr:dTMP kinase [Methylotenera sp.]MDI1309360.1 dTMP kinase [Methylotenera sp.]
MTNQQTNAKFITLEGMDGAGKSTHIASIIAALQGRGHEVVSTREPGGTALGERLRELLLHENMHVETETLLMFAARSEHIACVIKPALARGIYVLSDRFTDATYAYQCGAKGIEASKVQQLEQWVQGDLQPDVTILFDVPVEVSIQRLANAREPDKFERENADFFTRIRNAYLQRAKENPARFRVVDANRPLDLVKQSVEDIISTL